MNTYNPDKWAIIKFEKEQNVWYKVLGSWYGGYLNGDYWRLSSGLESVEENEGKYLMKNTSGSVYVCLKGGQGLSLTSSGILSTIQTSGVKEGAAVSLIDIEDYLAQNKGAIDEIP